MTESKQEPSKQQNREVIDLLSGISKKKETSQDKELTFDEKHEALAYRVAELEYSSKSIDIENRRTYASRIYGMIVGWLVAVILIIVGSGFKQIFPFYLSDNVLITLIGGTTVNVLGLFVIVVKYYFKYNDNQKKHSG